MDEFNEMISISTSPRKWTKDELIAYDAFLWSEEIRHLEDVAAIRKKRALLRKCGFASDEIGPWITEEEIINSMEDS